jgi:hypothetical protein
MINPPHIFTARLERAIVVNEHRRYAVQCMGDLIRENELRLELDYLNKQYFASHGYSFHSRQTKPYETDVCSSENQLTSFCSDRAIEKDKTADNIQGERK